jgi:hypothetical protein
VRQQQTGTQPFDEATIAVLDGAAVAANSPQAAPAANQVLRVAH